MFKDNKYSKWYFNIVDRALTTEQLGYTEKHHIIPKSCGGTNDPSNLVKLTAKAHFICHLLLTKMMIDPKHKKSMCFAFHCLKYNHRTINNYKTSHAFSTLREERSAYLRQTKMSDDARAKISKANSGKVRTDAVKLAISQKNKGKISHFKGKHHTEETKQKISAAAAGRKWSDDRRKTKSEQMKNKTARFNYGDEHNKKISDSKRQNSRLFGTFRIFFNNQTYVTSNIWEFAETNNLPINTLRMLILNPALTAKQGKCKSMRIEIIQEA